MKRTTVLVVLVSMTLAIAWAGTPMVGANNARSMPSGQMLPPLHKSAMDAIVGGLSPASNRSPQDWGGDVLIDTGYMADFAVDYSLADGTMWLAEAPLLESIVFVYRSVDHGATWNNVFWFTTNPLSTVKRLGLVLGEGDSSYVNVFFLNPASENGNVGVVRIKPDLTFWDAYWVLTGPDSITDFAVCRDYRSNYSLYCWAVVGSTGQQAPWIWSRDFGKTWVGTSWFNVIEPFLAPSAGPRVNFTCMNAQRTYVTAGYNFNYGDSTSWHYGIVNGDTFKCYKPKIAAANTLPDSIATRWVMYTKSYQNSGDYDAMYAASSDAWGDTWQRENVFSWSSAYNEGIGDLQHYKAIGNTYVNLSFNELVRSGGDTSNAYWTYANAPSPYGWASLTPVNDSGTMVAWPTLASRLVYSPGAPGSGSGVVYARAGAFYIPHGLYFDAPWLALGVADRSGKTASRLAIAPSVARGPVELRLPAGTLRVLVFDATGRSVQTFAAPSGTLRWDLRNTAGARVAPGVYFVRAETGQGAASGKVIVQ
jgi:hypothetical protein